MNNLHRVRRDGQSWPGVWRVWLGWVLASTAGWAVGGPLGVAAVLSGDIIPAGYVGIASGGSLAGLLQWLVLRRHVAAVRWWVATNPVAAAAAGTVIFAGGTVVGADGGWVLGTGLIGPLVGLLQWRVLRGRVSKAGWWVLTSTAGWIAGGPGVGIVFWIVNAPAGAAWAALGFLNGAVTACALVWLLRQTRSAAATD